MIKYSDVYVSILAKGLCGSGEQFVVACAVNHQPLWSFRIPFFRHAYLLVVTTKRLIALDHRKGLLFDRLDRADSYAWSDLGSCSLAGVLTKKIHVKDKAGDTLLKGRVTGFFGPIANNGGSAQTLLQTWEQRRSLASGLAPATLPRYAAA
jgi:hypothetical protein